jgi:hypothetical protein
MTIHPKAKQWVEVVELIAFPILGSVMLNVSTGLLSTGKQESSLSFALRVFFLYSSTFWNIPPSSSENSALDRRPFSCFWWSSGDSWTHG